MQELIAASVIVAIIAFCSGYLWAIARDVRSSNKRQRKWSGRASVSRTAMVCPENRFALFRIMA